LFLRGLRNLSPDLVRRSIWLWWHDTTAKEIGQLHAGQTVHLLDAASINALDDARLLPGDLAVTRDGVHIMAYIGEHTWIEADPGVGRVIRVKTPANDNGWFDVPVRIVRWGILKPAGGT